jgi:GT2 family glycosyltransferase
LANQEQFVSYYKGGCHAIHRRVIEQCGGYQNTTLYGEEEVEFSYRVLDAGFEIVYLPDVKVHHYPQQSVVPKEGNQRDVELYYHIRNRFFIAYTYLPMLYIPSYLGFWLSFYGLRAIREGAWKDYLQGIAHGVATFGYYQRRILGKQTIVYLKSHYGRLWY